MRNQSLMLCSFHRSDCGGQAGRWPCAISREICRFVTFAFAALSALFIATYASPRTMRQHITDARSRRHLQQARHSPRLLDSNSHCL
jgi:hypothetical protein